MFHIGRYIKIYLENMGTSMNVTHYYHMNRPRDFSLRTVCILKVIFVGTSYD